MFLFFISYNISASAFYRVPTILSYNISASAFYRVPTILSHTFSLGQFASFPYNIYDILRPQESLTKGSLKVLKYEVL